MFNINIESWESSARSAMSSGRLDEAAAFWREVLSVSPHHSTALLHLGQHALMKRDFREADDLLSLAAKSAPTNPVIPLNQAYLHRARGEHAAELNALTRSLAIDPYFFPALLSKAMYIEREGGFRQAALIYKDALSILPSEDQIPSGMTAAVTHARNAVRANAAALEVSIDAELEAAQAKYSTVEQSRFRACKDIAIGKRTVFTQRPSLLHFPSLPAIEFYDNSEFPWIADLEAATDSIREEFITLFGDQQEIFSPYINYPAGAPLNQWAELNNSSRWSALHLWRDGVRVDSSCGICPKTISAASAVPMIDIPNFGPTVLFSVLAPRTHIPPHTGSTNIRLIVHLPLIVPNGCKFRVGSQTRQWKEGRAWIFDDTLEHEAFNDSDKFRVILMIDIWNHYLTQAERELVAVLLNGVHNFYHGAR